jgi:endonuclease YncB( thermonuclease family)
VTLAAPFVYNATVTRVIDGDTIVVDVDWGFRRHDVDVPVRLLGCNAIELSQPGGPEARDNLAALLPTGSPVLLLTAKPDKYAPRWDAHVTYLTATGAVHDLVADLIADGWAAAWNGTGPRPLPPWPRTDQSSSRGDLS